MARYVAEAGYWEQGRDFVACSRHRTIDAARRAARRLARRFASGGPATGGPLSWAGGWRELDGPASWVRGDGFVLLDESDGRGWRELDGPSSWVRGDGSVIHFADTAQDDGGGAR